MLKRTISFGIAVFLLFLECVGGVAHGQMPEDGMSLPIPTTIVLVKPAPGTGFQGKRLITIAVGKATYRFILKDGYTNHMYVRFPSIWEQVRQSSPNLNAEGIDSDQFGAIEPGATVTIFGMYKPAQRCFEVMSVDPGERRFDGTSEQQHY